ncbi:MAG: DUF4870 domain-containing protein [Chloroflexota bacterium]|nr:DUF4870 domain-containing protein [Chloroflexota bacterium]
MPDARVVQEVVRGDVTAGSEPVRVSPDEWTVASLAHASVVLTMILGIAGGVGALVGLAVPLAMYFGYRERSRFVAFHALQSLIYQMAGVLIYAVLAAVLAVWMTMAWTLSGLLASVLVGLLLMPFALLLTLLAVLLLVCAPFAWLGYGLYGAYHVYQGGAFRYWLIGEWLEKKGVKV